MDHDTHRTAHPQRSFNGTRLAAQTLATALVACALAACGGGGGGGSTAATSQGTGSGTSTSAGAGTGAGDGGGSGSGTSATAMMVANSPDAFYFQAGVAYADLSQFESATGGSVYSTWSPSGPAQLATAGAKVLFFGAGDQCASSTHDGTVATDSTTGAAATAASFGLPASVAHSWIPSGATSGCAAAVQGLTGRSAVVLGADANVSGDNALMVRTYAGPGDATSPSFLLPQPAGSINADITNTTVMFRQPFPDGATRQPWATTGVALIHAEQAVSAMPFPSGLASGEVAQSKQQLMATFVNRTCFASHTTYGHPCQVQVVLHTAIARTDGAAIPTTARIWFDRAQGGVLVLNGVIPAAGQSQVEGTSGDAVYTSYGAATQQGPFSRRAFDVGITLAQLQTMVRIGTAQSLGVPLASLTDAQVASVWGPTWNSASDWSLLNADAAQEIYNNSGTRNASIDGEWYSLYVGPKA